MALVVVAGLAMAGCLSSGPGSDIQSAFGGGEDEVHREEHAFSHSASADASPGWTTAGSWAVTAPEGLIEGEAALETEEAGNDWRLRMEAGGQGTTLRAPPGETSASGALDEPGSYELHLESRGPRVPDEVAVDVVVEWRGPEDAAGASGGGAGIQFERTDDGRWRATVTHRDAARAGERVDLEADTFNGRARVATEGDRTEAAVAAYGVAETKERARELAADVEVQLRATPASVVATAAPGDEQTGDDENQGAHLDVRTPARVAGRAATDNGPVQLADLVAGRLEASTANGAIQGSVTGHGDLTVSTSNGAVDLDVSPARSLRLDAGTDNGAVELGLEEGPDVGYEIGASTDNGRITEEMDEADLQEGGGPGADKVLRTDGYESRPIQVDGPVGTANGNVHFQGR